FISFRSMTSSGELMKKGLAYLISALTACLGLQYVLAANGPQIKLLAYSRSENKPVTQKQSLPMALEVVLSFPAANLIRLSNGNNQTQLALYKRNGRLDTL